MIQPVDLKDFLLTFFVSAGIILSGACYALFYAWARLRDRPRFLRWALLAYAVLAVCAGVLMMTAHLDGSWRALTVMMLIGYFLAPSAIFRLCAATHDAEAAAPGFITTKEKTP
jgi:uncharacterized membrane protein HdeD (DUF308 family)